MGPAMPENSLGVLHAGVTVGEAVAGLTLYWVTKETSPRPGAPGVLAQGAGILFMKS